MVEGGRLGHLVETFEKVMKTNEYGRISTDDLNCIRIITNKINKNFQLHNEHSMNVGHFVWNQAFVGKIFTLLESPKDRGVTLNAIEIILAMLVSSVNIRKKFLSQYPTSTQILLKVINQEYKSCDSSDDIIITTHKILAIIGSKDGKFPSKMKSNQAARATVAMLRKNVYHADHVVALLKVLKLCSSDGVLVSQLSKLNVVDILVELLFAYMRKSDKITKLTLLIFILLFRGKSCVDSFISQGGVEAFLEVIDDWTKDDAKTKSLKIRSSLLLVLNQVVCFRSGILAMQKAGGVNRLYLLCLSLKPAKKFERLSLLFCNVMRNCLVSNKLPISSLSGPYKFAIFSCTASSLATADAPGNSIHAGAPNGRDDDTSSTSLSSSTADDSKPVTSRPANCITGLGPTLGPGRCSLVTDTLGILTDSYTHGFFSPDALLNTNFGDPKKRLGEPNELKLKNLFNVVSMQDETNRPFIRPGSVMDIYPFSANLGLKQVKDHTRQTLKITDVESLSGPSVSVAESNSAINSISLRKQSIAGSTSKNINSIIGMIEPEVKDKTVRGSPNHLMSYETFFEEHYLVDKLCAKYKNKFPNDYSWYQPSPKLERSEDLVKNDVDYSLNCNKVRGEKSVENSSHGNNKKDMESNADESFSDGNSNDRRYDLSRNYSSIGILQGNEDDQRYLALEGLPGASGLREDKRALLMRKSDSSFSFESLSDMRPSQENRNEGIDLYRRFQSTHHEPSQDLLASDVPNQVGETRKQIGSPLQSCMCSRSGVKSACVSRRKSGLVACDGVSKTLKTTPNEKSKLGSAASKSRKIMNKPSIESPVRSKAYSGKADYNVVSSSSTCRRQQQQKKGSSNVVVSDSTPSLLEKSASETVEDILLAKITERLATSGISVPPICHEDDTEGQNSCIFGENSLEEYRLPMPQIASYKRHTRGVQRYLELSSRTRSVIQFTRIAYPDLYGHLLPPENEFIQPSRRVDILRKKMLEDINRQVDPSDLINTLVYSVDDIVNNHPGTQNNEALSNDDEKCIFRALLESKRGGKKCPHLIFDSQFESGNLRKAIQVKEYEYDLILMPDINTKGQHQWFYFRVTEMRANTPYKFNVINCEKPNSQFNFGMQPLLFSVAEALLGHAYWRRAGEEGCYYRNHILKMPILMNDARLTNQSFYYTATFTLTFKHSPDVCYMAYHYPYTYTTLMHCIDQLENTNNSRNDSYNGETGAACCSSCSDVVDVDASKNNSVQNNYKSLNNSNHNNTINVNYTSPLQNKFVRENSVTYFKKQILCKTLGGNDVPLLTVTALPILTGDVMSDAEALQLYKGRPYIFLTARVHPGESNASWVMRGTLDFLLSECESAKQLRENYIFKIVPMLNPDGVINGNHRCSLYGDDLNRQWLDPSLHRHSTIFHTKALMQYLRAKISTTVNLFCDYHGHSRRKNVFLYGCSPLKSWVPDDFNNPTMLPDKTEDQSYKIIPAILSTFAPGFQLSACNYSIEKVKETTARVVVWREIGLVKSYTMESTYCGFDQGQYKGLQINTYHHEEMGRNFALALSKSRAYPDDVTSLVTTPLVDQLSQNVEEVVKPRSVVGSESSESEEIERYLEELDDMVKNKEPEGRPQLLTGD